MTCIRLPGSEWTLCPCPTCRTDQSRKAKIHRLGRVAVNDVRPQAWARVIAWVEAGYSCGAIQTLTGVGSNAAYLMVQDVKAGRTRPIRHATARRIMAAPARPADGGWVPSVGTVRRLQALTVMGWSMADLAARSDVAESTLHALRDPKHKTTRPRFAAAVERLYDELSGTRGPCQYAATRALRKGWAPPAAWDDIDDPAETPDGAGQSTQHRTREEVAEEVEHLLRFDPLATADRLAHRLGYADASSIQNPLRRAGRADLLATLARNAELAPRRTA